MADENKSGNETKSIRPYSTVFQNEPKEKALVGESLDEKGAIGSDIKKEVALANTILTISLTNNIELFIVKLNKIIIATMSKRIKLSFIISYFLFHEIFFKRLAEVCVYMLRVELELNYKESAFSEYGLSYARLFE